MIKINRDSVGNNILGVFKTIIKIRLGGLFKKTKIWCIDLFLQELYHIFIILMDF